MRYREIYDIINDQDLEDLINRLTTMFGDQWELVEVTYKHQRKSKWQLLPSKVPVKAVVEFNV